MESGSSMKDFEFFPLKSIGGHRRILSLAVALLDVHSEIPH